MTDNANKNQNPQAQQPGPQPHFEMLRVYSKNSSLETPNSPAVFRSAWHPRLSISFDVSPTLISTAPSAAGRPKSDIYEVNLRIEVRCDNMKNAEDQKSKDAKGDVAFICEVNQAGLFALSGYDVINTQYVLQAAAPTILFPYAREYISNLVNRGSFPPVNLAPINFDMLFRSRAMQQIKARQEAQQKAAQQQAAQQEAANQEKSGEEGAAPTVNANKDNEPVA